MIGLLEGLKDAVLLLLSIIEEFVLALLKALSYGIDVFKALQKVKVNIPIFSDLFKFFSGLEPTIWNMLTFIPAIPINFIYNVIKGDDLFDPDDVKNIKNMTIPFPRFNSSLSSYQIDSSDFNLSSGGPDKVGLSLSIIGFLFGIASGVYAAEIDTITMFVSNENVSKIIPITGISVGILATIVALLSGIGAVIHVSKSKDHEEKENKPNKGALAFPFILIAGELIGIALDVVTIASSKASELLPVIGRTTMGVICFVMGLIIFTIEADDGTFSVDTQISIFFESVLASLPLATAFMIPIGQKQKDPVVLAVLIAVRSALDLVGNITPGITSLVIVSKD